LAQLSLDQKEKLTQILFGENHDDIVDEAIAEKCDIGQMIETLFLHPSRKYYGSALIIHLSKYNSAIYTGDRDFEDNIPETIDDELCDALFYAVKAIL